MPEVMLKRREIAYLEEWAARRGRKPLVIRGARQVGKSTLVREFARIAGRPLGRIEYLHLGPLAFEDFLDAMGRPELSAHLRAVSLSDLKDAFPDAVHQRYLDLLPEYWIVGGLPEASS